MISASGRSNRCERTISSFSAAPKCRALNRPVFGSTRASASSCGTESDRWMRSTGATANGINHGSAYQKRRDDDSEAGECELGRQSVEREQARLTDRMPVPEQQHRREHRVVQADEDDRARKAGDCQAEARARDQPVGMEDQPHRPPRRDRSDHVVADVEALPVPGGPVLQPGRDVLHDGDDDDQLRRQEQDRGNQEDVRRVVRLVARRLDERDLCERGAGREQQERDPDLACCRPPSGAERRTAPRRARRGRRSRSGTRSPRSRAAGFRSALRSGRSPKEIIGETALTPRAHDWSPRAACPVSPESRVRSRREKMAPCLKLRTVKWLWPPPSE